MLECVGFAVDTKTYQRCISAWKFFIPKCHHHRFHWTEVANHHSCAFALGESGFGGGGAEKFNLVLKPFF